METWKPLQPTSRHTPPTPPTHTSIDAYAAPAQSTRSAPPAHPHPYLDPNAVQGPADSRVSVKRTSAFFWRSRANTSNYAPAPVDASSVPRPFASGLNAALPHLRRDGTVRNVPFALDSCGTLPLSAHRRIVDLLPLNDLLRYMLSCRQIAILVAQEDVWERRVRSVNWSSVKGCDVEEVEVSCQPPSSAADEEWTEFSSAKTLGQVSVASFTSSSFSTAATNSLPAANGRPILSSTARSSVPSCEMLPSYRIVKSYKIALRPLLDSLETSESAEASLLFTSRQWGPLDQQALLGNLIRAVLPASTGGGGLFAWSSGPESTSSPLALISPRCDLLLKATSHVTSHLLLLFKSACDRRFDALRAAEHGATGTSGAVMRGEGDMRVFAQAIWLTGKTGERLARYYSSLGSQDAPAAQGVEHIDLFAPAKYGSEAEATWFDMLDARHPLRWPNDPSSNIVLSASNTPTLNFTPMDATMSTAISYLLAEGALIARIFPPEQIAVLHWGQRVAERLIAEYIRPLLVMARSGSVHLYLRSCAATFTQSLRIAEALLQITLPACLPSASALARPTSSESETLSKRETDIWKTEYEKLVSREAAHLTIYRAWESLVGDYLSEERAWIKNEMDRVASEWEQNLLNQASASRVDAAFLTAQNPAAVKRTVLSSFRDVLLLPVTVVPRTAANVGGAVFRTAGKGVSQLNPLRWQGAAASNVSQIHHRSSSTPDIDKGYIDFSDGAASKVDQYSSEDEESEQEKPTLEGVADDGWNEEVKAWKEVANKATEEVRPVSTLFASSERLATLPGVVGAKQTTSQETPNVRRGVQADTVSDIRTPAASRAGTPANGAVSAVQVPSHSSLQRMQLLLSLDTALQMIHLNRDSLKRIDTFSTLPGSAGHQVQEAIEEVATTFLQCLTERHVSPGFLQATLQITSWTPIEKARAPDSTPDTSTVTAAEQEQKQHVEPLVHFFELIHVADTIAQMVQVYFDQELSRHIDRTDFFNTVVREKKRFEKSLDEAVAAGLNSGVDLLMGQIEHIIATTQDPRDYYPEAASDMDLGRSTAACSKAISCLRTHCTMLMGCTDKNVLEVFWQEIGIRLYTIVCKNLKRQIISLEGGFKVIADLNAYYAFVAGLKQPSLLPYFEALKMLGNLYVIEDPKELASLVRDASVFRGTLTPDDVYEFLQARCDFKAIEKAVDKEMYGFKIAEDCKVM